MHEYGAIEFRFLYLIRTMTGLQYSESILKNQALFMGQANFYRLTFKYFMIIFLCLFTTD